MLPVRKMRRFTLLLAVLFGDLGPARSVVAAEAPRRAEYITRNWQTADGLPQNIVQSILQTRDGYLWVGTQTGLARFDGVRFTTFTVANTPELRSDFVWELFEDREGTLWIGTRRGVVRLRDGKFTALGEPEGLPAAVANGFAEDATGTLWAVVGNRLFHRVGGRFEAVPVSGAGVEPSAVRAIRRSSHGELWVAAQGRLWRRTGERFESVAPLPEGTVARMALNAEDRVWVSLDAGGVAEFREGAWVNQSNGLMISARHLLFARNGDLWITSPLTNKLFRLRAGELTAFGAEDGLPGNNATAVAEDREGNLWTAMNGTGLFRLRERRLQVFDTSHGFPTLKLTSLAADSTGHLLAGVDGQGIFRLEAGRFERLADNKAIPEADVPASMLGLPNGELAVGTYFGDLKFWDGQRVTRRAGGEFGTRILLAARDGSLWRGTRLGGLEHHADGKVIRYGTEQGLSVVEVLCLAQDASGAIWAGTERGLNRIAGGKVTTFTRTNGLGSDYVAALCNDSQGTLWVGTLGGGLAAWRNGKFISLTTREGLSHDSITQIIEDDLAHLWLGTRAGLMRVRLDDLHAFLDGRTHYVHGTRFGRDDGLVPADCGTDSQPSCLKSADGRCWFCTGSGVVVVNPREIVANTQPPMVYVEQVAVDGVEQRPPFSVPAGRRRFEIRYTGLSFTAPSLVHFRHRLAGYDADWIEAGEQRVAYYSGLPPGRYTFNVTACNSDGVWNESGAALVLSVKPTFWQTGWFRGLVMLGAAGVLLAAYRVRIAQLERRRAAQEAFSRQLIDSQEQERKRIAGELHDSLGQNLLVIKNRAALALAQRNDPEKMAEQVGEVSTMASAAIREVREIAQNLRPFQIDELGLTKSIAAMARKLGDASGIEFRADLDDIDRALPPEFEINFYRIVQECLNNVVKHSQAKTASIILRREQRALRLTVQDDGRGFAAERGAHLEGRGFGLKNITERARTMGGEVRVQSSPGGGTRVEVTIPVR